MAVSISNITSGSDTDGNSTATTASVSPSSNKLLLLTIGSRTAISTDPNIPTATGLGLTWVTVDSVVWDTTSSSRKRITTLRALGTVSAGTISIDFGGQNQTRCYWTLEEVTGMDISGSNGSGAIVQSATNKDETPLAAGGTLTVTLSTFSNSNNATYGAFAQDSGDGDVTAGTGFTRYGHVDDSANAMSMAAEFRSDNDTTVTAINNSSFSGAMGGIAIEIRAAGVISVTNTTSGTDEDGNSTATTASVSPSANKLQLLTVVHRNVEGSGPVTPTASGNSLTWVAINSIIFDDVGTSRMRVTLFRAMGSSPTSGAITIDFSSENQTHVAWVLDEVTGMSTSGTNGSGAIVQNTTNADSTGTVSTITATLSAFSSSDNATYGAWGENGNETATQGSGFTLIKTSISSTNAQATSEFRPDNDTSVNMSYSANAQIGVVAIEIAAPSAGGGGSVASMMLLGVGA